MSAVETLSCSLLSKLTPTLKGRWRARMYKGWKWIKKINCRIKFQHRNYFCLLLWVLNPGSLNNNLLTLKNKMQKYNLCPAIIYWFLCDHSRRFTWCRSQLISKPPQHLPIHRGLKGPFNTFSRNTFSRVYIDQNYPKISNFMHGSL